MLTHRNVLANVDAIGQVFELRQSDVMVGVLPFFHSFGFTGTLWLPLVTGFGVVYHPNPMDAKTIGELAEQVSRHDPDQHADVLRRLRAQVRTRAVRPPALRDRRRREAARADRRRLPGEVRHRRCSKATAAPRWRRSSRSTFRIREDGEHQRGTRSGTVGHPLPGVVAKIVDPETGEGPLFGAGGAAAREGREPHAGLPRRSGANGRGAARRLVRHRRHRLHRRGRLHPHHRSPVAVQQDRRRNGAAHASSRNRSRRCWIPRIRAS